MLYFGFILYYVGIHRVSGIEYPGFKILVPITYSLMGYTYYLRGSSIKLWVVGITGKASSLMDTAAS